MKSSEVIKQLKAAGWQLARIRGSHHQFKHPDFAKLVTVPHPEKDIAKGTLHQILKDAGL